VLKDRKERLDRITFSAGIADVFAHSTIRSALEAADQALYRAKEGGRNRVCRG
jgi:diguanylate cyclase